MSRLETALGERILVLDGAMGTMLQAADPSMDDFQGHEGCTEVLKPASDTPLTALALAQVLEDAGFSKTEVYWEATDRKTGLGNDVYALTIFSKFCSFSVVTFSGIPPAELRTAARFPESKRVDIGCSGRAVSRAYDSVGRSCKLRSCNNIP